MRDDSGGYSYYCGITILTKYWLLTAAKCVLWGFVNTMKLNT